MSPVATRGPVRVVGTGLLGTSIGLALRALDVDVVLADPSRTSLGIALDMGAGRLPAADDAPVALVVVAAPPDVVAEVVAAELEAHPDAVVTDVASVKTAVRDVVAASGADLTRYVGSHPMAGRERSGPTAAQAELFAARPWVIVDSGSSSDEALLTVRSLAVDLGAVPVTMDAEGHDDAVATVSHLPQVAASLVAARLVAARPEALALAGQGLRDTTRIAASDARLWASILAANAGPVRELLVGLREDLDRVVAALDEGSLAGLARVVEAGNLGVARIPGKHGGAPRAFEVVTVLVPDTPGELARLLTEIGDAGINLEDLLLEHSPGQPVGLASLSVLPGSTGRLVEVLANRGWRIAGEEQHA